jgi:hypothetical protein
MTDWRLHGQERYLKQADLRWSVYEPPSEEWDHDHCEFCTGKFATLGRDFTEGFSTEDQHWICKECYEDFKSQFGWKVISSVDSAS